MAQAVFHREERGEQGRGVRRPRRGAQARRAVGFGKVELPRRVFAQVVLDDAAELGAEGLHCEPVRGGFCVGGGGGGRGGGREGEVRAGRGGERFFGQEEIRGGGRGAVKEGEEFGEFGGGRGTAAGEGDEAPGRGGGGGCAPGGGEEFLAREEEGPPVDVVVVPEEELEVFGGVGDVD